MPRSQQGALQTTPLRNVRHGSVILDADDTLWSTQPLYETAKDEFHALLKLYAVSRDTLARRLDEIDALAAREVGFGRDRFPRSMQTTYRVLCEEAGQSVDPAVLQEIADAGYRVFERSPQVYLGVSAALRLLGQQHELILLTKGDAQVQRDRIHSSGLESYFDHVYVVASKDAEAYAQVLRDLDLKADDCWAVGNSARSDINPAVEIGLRSVMIPNQSWVFETQQLTRPDKVKVTATLLEAAHHILMQERPLEPAR